MKHLVWFLLVIGAAYGTQQYYQQQYEPQLAGLKDDLDKATAAQKNAETQNTEAQAKLALAAQQATEAVAARNKAVQGAAETRQADTDKITKLTADLAAARNGSPSSKPSAEAQDPTTAATPVGMTPAAAAEAKRIADLKERLRTNQTERDTLQATLDQKQKDLTAWEAQGANHRKGTDLPVQISTLQKQLDDVLRELEVIQNQLNPGN